MADKTVHSHARVKVINSRRNDTGGDIAEREQCEVPKRFAAGSMIVDVVVVFVFVFVCSFVCVRVWFRRFESDAIERRGVCINLLAK